MKQMKYIIVDNGSWMSPYIFHEGVQHFEMANEVPGKVTSAGFIRFTSKGLECYGDSYSLGIKSKPEEDTRLVNRLIGGPKDD